MRPGLRSDTSTHRPSSSTTTSSPTTVPPCTTALVTSSVTRSSASSRIPSSPASAIAPETTRRAIAGDRPSGGRRVKLRRAWFTIASAPVGRRAAPRPRAAPPSRRAGRRCRPWPPRAAGRADGLQRLLAQLGKRGRRPSTAGPSALALLDLRGRLEPVHPRHLDVEQDQRDVVDEQLFSAPPCRTRHARARARGRRGSPRSLLNNGCRGGSGAAGSAGCPDAGSAS